MRVKGGRELRVGDEEGGLWGGVKGRVRESSKVGLCLPCVSAHLQEGGEALRQVLGQLQEAWWEVCVRERGG